MVARKNDMNRLVIIGAGGHGRVVASVAKLNGYEEVIFLDDDLSLDNISGAVCDYRKYSDSDFFVAIGNNLVREKISSELVSDEINIVSLIHPKAIVDETVAIGKGSIVMANAVINAGVTIGKGCIINTSSVIEHDCVIGGYSHVSVSTVLAGTVNIGVRCFIGANATIINNISVCNDVTIGAGAVVVKNITDAGIYIGVPAVSNLNLGGVGYNFIESICMGDAV